MFTTLITVSQIISREIDWEYALASSGYYAFWRLLSEMAVWRDAVCDGERVGALIAHEGLNNMRCIGAFVAVLISQTAYTAAAALSAKNAAASGWQWFKDTGTINTDDKDELRLRIASKQRSVESHAGMTMLSPSEPMFAQAIQGEYEWTDNVISMSVMQEDNVEDEQHSRHIADSDDTRLVTWVIDEGDTITGIMTTVANLNKSLAVHDSKRNNITTRDEVVAGTYFMAYSLYGLNMDSAPNLVSNIPEIAGNSMQSIGSDIAQEKKYQSGQTQLQVQSKFCAAIGEQPRPGDESVVVGEIYMGEEGGVDSQCNEG
uniref:ARAD1B00132p n=1 Tax=Blastobotrys adeninivorans TaxID=409370 RepID=A0A060T9L8_BLAAD